MMNQPLGGPSAGLLRVLIVDDEKDTAETLARVLARLGYECRLAHEVHAAIETAGDFRPDAVLLDIEMPRNGYRTAQSLRQQMGTSCPVIIAVTAYGDQEHYARSEQAGFHFYFVKPVHPERIDEVLRALREARAACQSDADSPQ